MTLPEELQYPILCFARDNSVSVAGSPAEFSSCNTVAWFQNRYFDDLRVYDAAATPFRVHAARLATPLSGWRRFLAQARNRRLIVVLNLEPLGEASLAAAKATALEWLHRAPDFWESTRDLSEWEELISQASSVRVLASVLA